MQLLLMQGGWRDSAVLFGCSYRWVSVVDASCPSARLCCQRTPRAEGCQNGSRVSGGCGVSNAFGNLLNRKSQAKAGVCSQQHGYCS